MWWVLGPRFLRCTPQDHKRYCNRSFPGAKDLCHQRFVQFSCLSPEIQWSAVPWRPFYEDSAWSRHVGIMPSPMKSFLLWTEVLFWGWILYKLPFQHTGSSIAVQVWGLVFLWIQGCEMSWGLMCFAHIVPFSGHDTTMCALAAHFGNLTFSRLCCAFYRCVLWKLSHQITLRRKSLDASHKLTIVGHKTNGLQTHFKYASYIIILYESYCIIIVII